VRHYEQYSKLKTLCLACIITKVTGYQYIQENAVTNVWRLEKSLIIPIAPSPQHQNNFSSSMFENRRFSEPRGSAFRLRTNQIQISNLKECFSQKNTWPVSRTAKGFNIMRRHTFITSYVNKIPYDSVQWFLTSAQASGDGRHSPLVTLRKGCRNRG